MLEWKMKAEKILQKSLNILQKFPIQSDHIRCP